MASNKKYWKSEAELNPSDSIVEALKQNEFVESIPVDDFLGGDKENLSATTTNRRDFLKYIGFSTAAASVAACQGPVHKSIPYVVQPENIIPGVANYYATSIADGFDFASILIKTREGRPIKVENNTDAKIGGGANARVQASVLSLYDSTRLQGPLANGEPVEWSALDAAVRAKLGSLTNSGQQIVFLTQTYASPSTERLINEFKGAYPNLKHVVYDAVAEDAALNAYEGKYGERALADYDFSQADLIVSFGGADFLGDWQGGGYDSGYAKGRIPSKGKMSRHVQFEANMTLSGANADKRVPLTPMQQKIALAKLYAKLNGTSAGGELPENVQVVVDSVAAQIKSKGSDAVVVTGLDDVNAQSVVLAINEMLGSKAFDAQSPRYTRQGSVKEVAALVADMNAGKIGALIMDGVNPMYTLPNAADFKAGLEKVGLSVTFSTNWNETTEVSQYVAASNHYLESWGGDLQIKKGHFGLMQPTIRELFDTRQFQESLLKWLGSDKKYYDYIKDTWANGVLNGADWSKALHDGGVFVSGSNEGLSAVADPEDVAQDGGDKEEGAEEMVAPAAVGGAVSMTSAINSLTNATSGGGLELTLY